MRASLDIAETLADVRLRLPDARAIWYRRALTYATRVEWTSGLLLGGAHSPLFLQTDHPLDPVTRRLPAALMAAQVRVAVCAGRVGPLDDWLPFLEAIKLAGESLVMVSAEPPPAELLEVLVVNTERRVAVLCAVSPGGESPAVGAAGAGSMPAVDEPPTPAMREELPLFELALVRRDASVLLGGAVGACTDGVAIIHVGGADAADVADRLAAVERAVSAMRVGAERQSSESAG